MRRLPPLTALEAFVQVARLGSVKAAAEELALSTPALSRRIQALERYVGRSLFERKHQALEINADGLGLLNDIAPALDAMSVAVEKLMNGGNQLRLRLAVMPLFASQRLLPLLRDLRQAYPLLHLDIETTPHAAARLGEGLDAAIILAREVDPALYVHELGREYIYLFGNAESLKQNPVEKPEDLQRHILLIHRDMPTIFEDWKEGVGCRDIQPTATDTYDSGPLMLEAAGQGLGIAIMLASHYTHSHDSRLVRLFDQEIESPYRYFFVCRPRALQNRAVRIFHDWLVAHGV
ncbi:MAG: LysR family transcriptional regulator [Sphingomonadales bacterium]|nr:MAG: LysR family transcriptional regulator [Sphingomonadales bacterium]